MYLCLPFGVALTAEVSLTNIQYGLVDLNALNEADETVGGDKALSRGMAAEPEGEMGKVHYGFVRALRVEKNVLAHQHSTSSGLRKLIMKIIHYLWTHVADPVDHRFTGRTERHVTAYHQVEKAIEELFDISKHGRMYPISATF
jgi:hypothetical protein